MDGCLLKAVEMRTVECEGLVLKGFAGSGAIT